MMKEHGAEQIRLDMALDMDFQVDGLNLDMPVKKELTKVVDTCIQPKTPQRQNYIPALPRSVVFPLWTSRYLEAALVLTTKFSPLSPRANELHAGHESFCCCRLTPLSFMLID